VRVEINRQIPTQPLKNNTNPSYDSEPIQGRSFKVLQQITKPKGDYIKSIKILYLIITPNNYILYCIKYTLYYIVVNVVIVCNTENSA